VRGGKRRLESRNRLNRLSLLFHQKPNGDSIMDDTIAAIATPSGGGVSIIKVSGRGALDVARKLFSSPGGLESHRVYYGFIVENGVRLDEALLIVMRAPRSYTAEDVAEFHCHGGPAVTRAVLNAALRAGARLAEPGEFTKRAFLNGRIDLSAAEAVAALIQAETEGAARAALRTLSGAAGKKAAEIKEMLISAIARIEAGIDFPDEIGEADLSAGLSLISKELSDWAESAKAGQIARGGVSAVIFGRPNAGKSTLMNRLTGEDSSIVSETPGTTRDVVRGSVALGGVAVRLADTAGIRAASGVEAAGVQKALDELAKADAAVFVTDGPLTEADMEALARLGGAPAVCAVNKADAGVVPDETVTAFFGGNAVSVSAKTGFGVDALKEKITEIVTGRSRDGGLTASARAVAAIERALESVLSAADAANRGIPADFVSIDLRGALCAIGEITGETLSPDIIDRVFSEFCLGK
jgi:tRNA modification GTPase